MDREQAETRSVSGALRLRHRFDPPLSSPISNRLIAGVPWPLDPVRRVRIVAAAILMTIVAVAGVLPLATAAQHPLSLVAAACAVLFGTVMLRVTHRGRLGTVGQVLLVVLVALMSASDRDLQLSAGLAQAAMALTGLYVSARRVVAQFVALQSVLTVSVLLKERIGVDAGLSVGEVLVSMVGLLVMASLTFSVVHVISRYADVVSREKLLLRVGTELAVAPTRRQIYDTLVQHLTVFGTSHDVHVLVAACDADGLSVSAEGPCLREGERSSADVGQDPASERHRRELPTRLTAGTAELERFAGQPIVRGRPCRALSPQRLDKLAPALKRMSGGETTSVVEVVHVEHQGAESRRTAPEVEAVLMSLGEQQGSPVVLIVTGREALPSHVAKSLRTLEPTIALALRNADLTEGLRQQASHDSLTGLLNRNSFEKRLEAALASRDLRDGYLAVLFFDLDGFKQINDQFGHAAGDKLLIAVAERIASCVRDTDSVARLGGDEFVVLLQDLSAEHEAHIIAQKIRGVVAQPLRIGDAHVEVVVSIGAAGANRLSPVAGEELLARADAAMYVAKAAGQRLRRTPYDDGVYAPSPHR